MGAFLEELYKYLSPELVSAMGGFKVMLFGGAVGVAEGHRGLKTLSDTEISFKLKRGLAVFEGEGLQISAYTKDSAVITGKISGVRLSP